MQSPSETKSILAAEEIMNLYYEEEIKLLSVIVVMV